MDPTGMSAENSGEGDPVKQPSLLESTFEGISSTLDEIVISAKKSGFSSEKISSDWEKNKEKSGFNHFKNWFKDKDLSAATGVANNVGTLAAAGIGNSSLRVAIGTARPDIPVNFLGNNYYGNGKWYIKGSYIGKFLGRFTFGLGIALDTYGLNEYKQNPNSPSAVSPVKMGVNTTMGALGFTGFGTPASLIYNGMEVLHPNGASGALEDYGEAQATYRKGNRGAVFKPEL